MNSLAMHGPIRRCSIALGLACTGVLWGCDQRETLVAVESQREAIEILVELEKAKVVGARVATLTRNRRDSQQITLPTSELGRARALLLQRDLPRKEHAGLETIAASDGIIPTVTDERARLMYAISGELERTLESIDGVSRARVHIMLPEKEALGEPGIGSVPTASVLLTVNWDAVRQAAVTESAAAASTPAMREGIPPAANFVVRHVDPVAAVDAQTKQPTERQAADLSAAVRSLVANAVPGLKDQGVCVVLSYAPTRSILEEPRDLAAKLVETDRRTKLLYVGTAVISALFLLTLAWGFSRGRGHAPPAPGSGTAT